MACDLMGAERPANIGSFPGDNSITPLGVVVQAIDKGFPGLSPTEMITALQMVISGDLSLPDSSKFYGGRFNASVIGEVFKAYIEQIRRPVIAQIEKNAEAFRQQLEEQQKEEKRRAFFENFEKSLLEWKGSTWQEVPAEWYQVAKDQGLFTIEREEAHDIYDRAKILAKADLQAEKTSLYGAITPEMIEARAIVFARKITLFEKVLKK